MNEQYTAKHVHYKVDDFKDNTLDFAFFFKTV